MRWHPGGRIGSPSSGWVEAGAGGLWPLPPYPSIYDAQYLGCWEAPPVVAQPQALAFQDEL